jgi:holo-[acyl-carrier protein] synthase
VHLSARFCAKEAYLKAIGTGVGKGMTLKDITVVMKDGGGPEIRLHGQAAALAVRCGYVKIHLSLSHTEFLAMAQVIVEKG